MWSKFKVLFHKDKIIIIIIIIIIIKTCAHAHPLPKIKGGAAEADVPRLPVLEAVVSVLHVQHRNQQVIE